MNLPLSMGTQLETIVLQLPVALDAALAAQAARSGRSKSEIVAALLQAHLTLDLPQPEPDPLLSDRLTALQERLTRVEHHLAYYQLLSQKHSSKAPPPFPIDDDIVDEPDEILEGFLD